MGRREWTRHRRRDKGKKTHPVSPVKRDKRLGSADAFMNIYVSVPELRKREQ